MKVTRQKNCYCHTCEKDYHYLGITMHRAGHRNRGENCTITFTYGNTKTWNYAKAIEKVGEYIKSNEK